MPALAPYPTEGTTGRETTQLGGSLGDTANVGSGSKPAVSGAWADSLLSGKAAVNQGGVARPVGDRRIRTT